MSAAGPRAQSQARPLPPQSDNKTKQDVSHGSKPGKPAGAGSGGAGGRGGGRRREPQNSSFSAINPGRPPPQRGAWPKQPTMRGGYPGDRFTVPAAVTEGDEFEVGSVFKSGSKKQSLNHLLNFQYTPRGQTNQRSREQQPRKNRKEVFRPSYSKEQYLLTNCQFIVAASGDYSVQEVDPDVSVGWELVEQVLLRTGGAEPLCCPICLFLPTAGKISKCGHVFCWPCVLHYLALSDEDWRKCPICYENISKADLRSVQVIQQEILCTGSTVEMRLMRRERNSLLSVPINHPTLDFFPFLEQEQHRGFSKIIKARPGDVMERILEQERRELEQQLREEQEQPESVFIREALLLLQNKMELCRELQKSDISGALYNLERATMPERAVQSERSVPEIGPIKAQAKLECPTYSAIDPFADLEGFLEHLTVEEGRKEEAQVKGEENGGIKVDVGARPRHSSSFSDNSSEGEETLTDTVSAEDLDLACVEQVHLDSNPGKQSPKSTFFFYQDGSGQLIFLHALNVQMLVHEFGSLELCPPIIRARIIEKDSCTLTAELRDRLRYLRHLPLSSCFEVAELDMSAVVGKKTFEFFKEKIEARERMRKRKLKAEKLREDRIRREEMRIMGRFPSPMARIESSYHYPRMDEDTPSTRRGTEYSSAQEASNQDTGHQASADTNGGSAVATGAALNFASIAKIRKQERPGAASSAAAAAQPLSNMIQLGGRLTAQRTRVDSCSEAELEGYIPPPPATSLGDALALALAQADKAPQGKKKGKKSRGKCILLTGGAQGPRL